MFAGRRPPLLTTRGTRARRARGLGPISSHRQQGGRHVPEEEGPERKPSVWTPVSILPPEVRPSADTNCVSLFCLVLTHTQALLLGEGGCGEGRGLARQSLKLALAVTVWGLKVDQ